MLRGHPYAVCGYDCVEGSKGGLVRRGRCDGAERGGTPDVSRHGDRGVPLCLVGRWIGVCRGEWLQGHKLDSEVLLKIRMDRVGCQGGRQRVIGDRDGACRRPRCDNGG